MATKNQTHRLPPQSIEAEQAVLGCMLIDPEAVAKVFHSLTENSFFKLAHSHIYNAMSDLFEKNDVGKFEKPNHLADFEAGDFTKYQTLTFNVKGSDGIDSNNAYSIVGNYEYYMPLQFWFCRNPGLALPLIALQYHEVKLKIGWGTLPTSTTAKVWVDYIYLDTDERRRFAQQSHEYLIEQLQKQFNYHYFRT